MEVDLSGLASFFVSLIERRIQKGFVGLASWLLRCLLLGGGGGKGIWAMGLRIGMSLNWFELWSDWIGNKTLPGVIENILQLIGKE
jgi:hypothetical protein